MAEVQQLEAGEPASTTVVGQFVGRAVAVVLGLLGGLAILSYHPRDTQILDGGFGPPAVIHNWIGRLGARFAAEAFAWLGLAVFPALLLILVCIAVRVHGRAVRPFRAVYLAGVLLFVWGCAMCIGVFPDALPRVAAWLNLTQTPGGVIGQRFCAPSTALAAGGWMSYVVNPTGSLIITAGMMLAGLATVWHFDWQPRTGEWWTACQERWLAARRPECPPPVIEVPVEEVPEPEPAPATPPPLAERVGPKTVRPSLRPTGVPLDAREAPAPPPVNPYLNYRLPSVKLLNELGNRTALFDPKEINGKKQALQQTLESFGIDASVGDHVCGPRVTLFEIKPAPGVKVERITALANNIAMNLKAENLRILAPIPGHDSVGIEVPNSRASQVFFRELLQSLAWREKSEKCAIPICLGKDIEGQPQILDLARAPHLLIAGATGSGKSVCINGLIMSLLYRFKPDELKLILVDPKVVEFACYARVPHLVTPVISDVKRVPLALHWAVTQMEWRYQILSKVGVRNIAAFNARKPAREPVLDDRDRPIPDRLPYVVIVIDELADIMMTSRQEVEILLARIAQMARAVGIHAVIATQRPSVNIITGIIKANFPTRVAFQVTSIVDSRTILDSKGAESLLGRGDMLYKPPDGSKLSRIQGCLVNDEEIERVVAFTADQAEAEFVEDMFKVGEAQLAAAEGGGLAAGLPGGDAGDGALGAADEALLQQAIQIILKDRRPTVSYVQRCLRIGYNKAAVIIEELERRGVLGPQIGTAQREILIAGDPANAATADDAEPPADKQEGAVEA